MKCPAELHTASARAYAGLPELTIPSTIEMSSSRGAVASACIERRSISPSCWPGNFRTTALTWRRTQVRPDLCLHHLVD
jgi:hypothetical protein